MARTLVIIGHPHRGSFTHALADRYVAGVRLAGVHSAGARPMTNPTCGSSTSPSASSP